MKFVAILVAAGKSERFGRDKLWVELGGSPLWLSSFRTLKGTGDIDGVGIVVPKGQEDRFRECAPDALFVCAGGATRQESVTTGLRHVPKAIDAVLVHDAARPFVTTELVSRVCDAVRESGAAFAAVPVTDTVWQNYDGMRRLDRDSLVAAQTPQGARREWLESAMEAPGHTDEAGALLAAGYVPAQVHGDPANIKITNASDILSPPLMESRSGFGYDVHRFSTDPDRPLWLGCVEFDERPGLLGHSDADVLAHAVCDALLGAAGLGDIGQHFPDSDPQWKDRRSRHFLGHVASLLAEKRWKIVNIDTSVLAERPRIGAKRSEMAAAMAEALRIEADLVCVKATTNEGLGSIGRGEGVAAFATVTLVRTNNGDH